MEGSRRIGAERKLKEREKKRVRETDGRVGGVKKKQKQKLTETEEKKEERRGFIIAEAALRWNLFICSVNRKSLIGECTAQ